MHDQEAGGNLRLRRSPALIHKRAIRDWRVADVLVEETAERTKAFEADFEANIGHGESAR